MPPVTLVAPRSQAVESAPAQPGEPVAAPVRTGERDGDRRASTVVVLPAAEEAGTAAGQSPDASPSLAEVARAERERRQRLGRPSIRIDDKNLAEFSKGQQLTEAKRDVASAGGEEKTAPVPEAAFAGETGRDLPDEESYWRERIRSAREQWAEAVEEVRRLERESARLRREFYAADDPYDRDARIKPLWDRALEELKAARQRAEEGPRRVATILDEGRRAGALPGWLREGLELEPEESADSGGPARSPAEPVEPRVLQEAPPR